MRISGFSFVKNAVKLYYPVVESIRSILPLVDELVIACGDSDDGTTELVRSIGDPKINIIQTIWDKRHFVKGAVNAVQTNIALDACTGDWCMYLQADEVMHERYFSVLRKKMEKSHFSQGNITDGNLSISVWGKNSEDVNSFINHGSVDKSKYVILSAILTAFSNAVRDTRHI